MPWVKTEVEYDGQGSSCVGEAMQGGVNGRRVSIEGGCRNGIGSNGAFGCIEVERARG